RKAHENAVPETSRGDDDRGEKPRWLAHRLDLHDRLGYDARGAWDRQGHAQGGRDDHREVQSGAQRQPARIPEDGDHGRWESVPGVGRQTQRLVDMGITMTSRQVAIRTAVRFEGAA